MKPLHDLLPDLEARDVRRVVHGQRVRMRQCYDRALRRAGKPQSVELTVRVQVLPSGEVGRVQVQGDRLVDLHDCLGRLARRWRFPPSRKGAEVPVPVAFAARDAQRSR